ncbi:MAG: tetratricopeptide repeat protein [Rhizomicrobium sp.]
MSIVLILIYGGIAAVALAFVSWPLWRAAPKGRWLLTGALAAFMLGIAGGAYVLLGHPELALRSLAGPKDTDLKALVSRLAWRVRQSPGDARGWMLLGRGYLTLDDPNDAAAAFKRAALLVPPMERPALFSAYGEALTVAALGTVTPEAEAAFKAALAGNPSDFASRFYLGQAYAERRDTAHALQMWESLLADTPPNAPWREALLDRIAMLKGAIQGPPNIAAMVQRLADRLKAHPNDPVGWRRLVKAYVVLGEADKARGALADARKALSGDHIELAALEAEARDLNLAK